jgi:hypothetical protein
MQKVQFPLEFIRNLLKFGKKDATPPARGSAPVQSQEEQDATRTRMEAEMDQQRERREASNASNAASNAKE